MSFLQMKKNRNDNTLNRIEDTYLIGRLHISTVHSERKASGNFFGNSKLTKVSLLLLVFFGFVIFATGTLNCCLNGELIKSFNLLKLINKIIKNI